ncbi:unnamed protein product [Phytomonas sp. Hart1]|nr:unnamed protein product [Phytomonas sp. Hart1]|eukprot:CCW69227.1 unnamed protein product [Phytomonas sp. isolate Hart1]
MFIFFSKKGLNGCSFLNIYLYRIFFRFLLVWEDIKRFETSLGIQI